MQPICCQAKQYVEAEDRWGDVQLLITPGFLSILYQPKGQWCFSRTDESVVLKSFRNWFKIVFHKPLMCIGRDITFDEETCEIIIDVGLPVEEPFILRFDTSDINDLKGIKKMWLSEETKDK